MKNVFQPFHYNWCLILDSYFGTIGSIYKLFTFSYDWVGSYLFLNVDHLGQRNIKNIFLLNLIVHQYCILLRVKLERKVIEWLMVLLNVGSVTDISKGENNVILT